MLCCFWLFQICVCGAVICEINYYDGENKTSQYSGVEYNAEFINEKIKEEIAKFAKSGYPFVKISPKITERNDSLVIDLFIDRGNLVQNVNAKFVIDGKLKHHLVERPVLNILQKNIDCYNYLVFEKAKNILQNKRYISSVSVFLPQMQDSVYEIPIKIIPYNSAFFDGGLGFANYPENTITGNATLEIVNVLGLGEVVDFSYIREELFYKIGANVQVPYVFATPLGALLSADVEIADYSYGSIGMSVGVQYFFGEMTAAMTADYSELTVSDTISRYTGISVSLDNGERRFLRSKHDFQIKVSAKSGMISAQNDRMPKGEIATKSAIHIPFGNTRAAYLTKPNFGIIAYEEPWKLHKTQIFRLGGAKSVRGYQESVFPCLSFVFLGNDFRYYINDFGSVYLLFDYGAIMQEKYGLSQISQIFGYGTGISLPVGKLVFSLEWARHYKEYSSMGRIHFRLGNH